MQVADLLYKNGFLFPPMCPEEVNDLEQVIITDEQLVRVSFGDGKGISFDDVPAVYCPSDMYMTFEKPEFLGQTGTDENHWYKMFWRVGARKYFTIGNVYTGFKRDMVDYDTYPLTEEEAKLFKMLHPDYK